jgi:hypothetical protein
LSNWVVCEFDVGFEPDGSREIFSKVSSGDELHAWRRADAKIASPENESTSDRAPPPRDLYRKTRKFDTTDRPLVAAELERKPAAIST